MAAISTLIIAISIFQLANGFFGTLVSPRVSVEQFSVPLGGSDSQFLLCRPAPERGCCHQLHGRRIPERIILRACTGLDAGEGIDQSAIRMI